MKNKLSNYLLIVKAFPRKKISLILYIKIEVCEIVDSKMEFPTIFKFYSLAIYLNAPDKLSKILAVVFI